MRPCRNSYLLSVASLLLILPAAVWADVGGRISGTVRDASGAVVPGASVKAIEVDTGVQQKTATSSKGTYSFLSVPVGRYRIEIDHAGFKPYQRTGIQVNANSSLLVDAVLDVGERNETVTVEENVAQVETSSTQMGQVIPGNVITAVPLNGRSYTDLLALQPGVAAATSITSSTVQDVGATALAPSGNLNPGTISINGQREFANGFMVNGSDVEEAVNMGAAIIPNLDSIAEFRILSSNFDAEYGGHSGGQINVITKSGSNSYHGSGFEFLRNTDLDARNYFSPSRAAFDQNQFGGTLGGPIRQNKVFFFADYQGTRLTEGVDTGDIPVPTLAERNGDFAGEANQLTNMVNSANLASLLTGELGYAVHSGEYYYTPGCTSPAKCVFPSAVIPQRAWSTPAQQLLKYIPTPNSGDDTFSTSAENETLGDNKGAFRLDDNTKYGTLTAYYFADDYTLNNPYPTGQGGANVPGFNALNFGRAQLLNLGDAKTINATTLNEFRFSYMRDTNDLGQPVGGLGVSLASQGFEVGAGTPGIVPLSPAMEGVESVGFNGFTIGTNTNELKQVNNTFEWMDDFSKVVGNHTYKFGADFHYDQVNTDAVAQANGSFLFFGSSTGLDFADFLLGLPSQYNQSQLQPFYGRNKYLGLFAQDSWRMRPNLTVNYGLRWDRIEPWYEKYNQLAVFEPGKQSVVFPTAPPGILFPGDPGVPRTLAPPGSLDFAPRLGLAYSPSGDADTILGKLFGTAGKSSIRAGFGMFYSAIEALSLSVLSGNAPYGTTYTSPTPPLFATPFMGQNGQNVAQPFPAQLAPLNSSPSNPDPNINWSQYEPISGIPAYATNNRIPYSEQYMLSLQRQIGTHSVLSVSYAGNQAHHLLALVEANPGNPALCLSLPGCGPFAEGGTRGPLGPSFGSDTYQSTIGNSNYNALEASFRYTAGRLDLNAGYTYSKSIDDSSNLGEEVNPLDPRLSRAVSAFDMRHNFVVNYTYRLPFDRLFGPNRFTRDWILSGITRFASGFPVTLYNNNDTSLLGTEPNGVNNFGVDQLQYSGGALNLNGNPHNGLPYFNTSQFSLPPLGQIGNAPRRFFYGPGINNFDMALEKDVHVTESKMLQFRLEGFNVFNHAQFFGPSAVDGNINSPTFGQIVNAAPPRLMQVAVKFHF
jgi:Carboxypeptidase regulatory-like domain